MAQRMTGDLSGAMGESIRAEAEAHARALMERMLAEQSHTAAEQERIRAAIAAQREESVAAMEALQAEREKKAAMEAKLREMQAALHQGRAEGLMERTIEQARPPHPSHRIIATHAYMRPVRGSLDCPRV